MRGGEEDYSSTVATLNNVVEGVPVVYLYNTNPKAYEPGLAKFVTATKITDLDLDSEYKISFDSVSAEALRYSVWIYFCDANGNAIGDFLYMKSFDDKLANATNLQHNECNFTLSNSGLSSNQNVFLAIEFVVSQDFSQNFRIGGSAITITNLDDNSAFFDGIWGTIKHIFYAIVGGTCEDEGCGYSTVGLFGKLKEGLESLGNRIGEFFTEFKQNWNAGIEAIKQKFKDISDAITNKLNDVKTGIVTVIENIKEDLKALFIPSDGFFDDVKSRLSSSFEEHFGALYQGPQVMVNFIRKLLEIQPGEASLTFPKIEFYMPNGTGGYNLFTLMESKTLDLSYIYDNTHPIFYFYSVYRGFTYVILFFLFVYYIQRKYDSIFGGDNNDN